MYTTLVKEMGMHTSFSEKKNTQKEKDMLKLQRKKKQGNTTVGEILSELLLLFLISSSPISLSKITLKKKKNLWQIYSKNEAQ